AWEGITGRGIVKARTRRTPAAGLYNSKGPLPKRTGDAQPAGPGTAVRDPRRDRLNWVSVVSGPLQPVPLISHRRGVGGSHDALTKERVLPSPEARAHLN